MFTVNGKKVDIPSFTTKVGDVIVVRSNRRDIEHFKIVKEGVNRVIPKWITTTAADLTATVNALPQRDDVDLTLQENMGSFDGSTASLSEQTGSARQPAKRRNGRSDLQAGDQRIYK